MKTLEGLELVVNAGCKGADSNITDVSEEVFNADLLSFLSFDDRGRVYEGFCGSCTVLYLQSCISHSTLTSVIKPTQPIKHIIKFHRGSR